MCGVVRGSGVLPRNVLGRPGSGSGESSLLRFGGSSKGARLPSVSRAGLLSQPRMKTCSKWLNLIAVENETGAAVLLIEHIGQAQWHPHRACASRRAAKLSAKAAPADCPDSRHDLVAQDFG
jgi:hypothetical protein